MSESDISFRPLDEQQIADLNQQLVRLKKLAADVGVDFFGDAREADLDALNILASGLEWPRHEVAIFDWFGIWANTGRRRAAIMGTRKGSMGRRDRSKTRRI
jgi:hypothetical protein